MKISVENKKLIITVENDKECRALYNACIIYESSGAHISLDILSNLKKSLGKLSWEWMEDNEYSDKLKMALDLIDKILNEKQN